MSDKALGFYFKKISDQYAAKANSFLKDFDITLSQMDILLYLCEQKEESMPQKAIEVNFDLKHPTVVGLLQRMEKKELIRVAVNPNDQRSNIVFPTDKARQIIAGTSQIFDKLDQLILSQLSEDQAGQLKKLLAKVYEEIRGVNGGDFG